MVSKKRMGNLLSFRTLASFFGADSFFAEFLFFSSGLRESSAAARQLPIFKPHGDVPPHLN